MTKLLLILAMLASTPTFAKGGGHSSGGKTHVKSYTKKSGTHVAAHNRTKKNKTKNDNWSTKGNTNPETGGAGTKDP